MPNEPRSRPYILSFSRKTDGPRYYADWFETSWKRGWAESRTSFGVPIRAELGPDSVAAMLGWTREARPFRKCLELLRSAGVPTAWQFTVTAYGRDLEPERPSDGVGSLLWLRDQLPDSNAIEWRYDPIILGDARPESWHVDAFGRIANRLRGATRVCNTSVVEPYRRTVRRLADETVPFRATERGRGLVRCFQSPALLAELTSLGRENGIELRVCANPELELPASQCCSMEMFQGYPSPVRGRVAGAIQSPTRPGCRCLRSLDIGMDESCMAGCRYCYAVSSSLTAIDNRRRHDPRAARIR